MADEWRTPEEARERMRKEYPLAFPIAVALGVVLVLLVGGMALYGDHDAWGYGINVFTSVVSTVATVLILDRLAERRADRKAEEALKRQLVDDAGSISNEIAKNAVHQLKRKGWLQGEDGLLKGADLYMANLKGADLYKANLEGARLKRANLEGADLYKANLQNANLVIANLQGAELDIANLRFADFSEAVFAKSTALPDRTNENPSYWTDISNMARFTDPTHPDFWEPEWVKQQREE